jgi:hypothetical protein
MPPNPGDPRALPRILPRNPLTVARQRTPPAARGRQDPVPEPPKRAPPRTSRSRPLLALLFLIISLAISIAAFLNRTPRLISFAFSPCFFLQLCPHARVKSDLCDPTTRERGDRATEGTRDHATQAHHTRGRTAAVSARRQLAQAGGAECVAAAGARRAGQTTGRAAPEVEGTVADIAVQLAPLRKRGHSHQKLHGARCGLEASHRRPAGSVHTARGPYWGRGWVLGPAPRPLTPFNSKIPPSRRHATVGPLPAAARVGAVEARTRECE